MFEFDFAFGRFELQSVVVTIIQYTYMSISSLLVPLRLGGKINFCVHVKAFASMIGELKLAKQVYMNTSTMFDRTLIRVAPESWTAHSPCAFGNFFLSK